MHPPSQSRFNLLKIVEALHRPLSVKLLSSELCLPHKILIIRNDLLLFWLQQIKYRHRLLVFQEKLDVLRRVQFLLQLQNPFEYFINHSFWQIKNFWFFALDQEIDVLSADLYASVEEFVPDVLRLDLDLIRGLLLAAQQLRKSIFYEHYYVFFVQIWDYALVYAKLLERMQLEEICEPEDVLHQ